MLKKLTILSLTSFWLLCTYAQDTIVMPVSGNGGFYNTCYAVIYDNGLDSNYHNYSNSTITISPLWVENVSLYFEEFSTETFFDTLSIYDGPGTTFPKIGAYSGSSLQGQTVSSTENAITLEFNSDDIQTSSGFKAWVSCTMSSQVYSYNDLLIYPNPVGDHFSITGVDVNTIHHFEILDLCGKKILESPSLEFIDIGNISSGVYTLLLILNNGKHHAAKLMKE